MLITRKNLALLKMKEVKRFTIIVIVVNPDIDNLEEGTETTVLVEEGITKGFLKEKM